MATRGTSFDTLYFNPLEKLLCARCCHLKRRLRGSQSGPKKKEPRRCQPHLTTATEGTLKSTFVDDLPRRHRTYGVQNCEYLPGRTYTEASSNAIMEFVKPPGPLAAPHAPKAATLLGLAAELRLKIYEDALEHSHVKLCHRSTVRAPILRNDCALLQVCRLIRNEVLPTFYSTIVLEFLDGFTEQDLHRWMSTVGEESISDLRRLYFSCANRCSAFNPRASPPQPLGRMPSVFYSLPTSTLSCRRRATVNLDSLDEGAFTHTLSLPIRAMDAVIMDCGRGSCPTSQPCTLVPCSNYAPGCHKSIREAVRKAVGSVEYAAGKPQVTPRYLLAIWRALSLDGSEAVLSTHGTVDL